MRRDEPAIWDCSPLVAGEGAGLSLRLDEPLSFWGGYDARAGRIVQRDHPQYGAELRGRVLLMRAAKGSSSSASVLAEAVRAGTAPAAIVMWERDLIVALGCIVAAELYGLRVPVVTVNCRCWERFASLPESIPLRVRAHAFAATVTLPGAENSTGNCND